MRLGLAVVLQRGIAATKTIFSVPSVALKASTQRTRRVSVTSVFNLSLAAENTEKKASRNNNVPGTGATVCAEYLSGVGH
jgi:hypothetical protein